MYFKHYEQSHYANIEYTIVEISPQMCKKALEKLSRDHQRLVDRGQIKVVNEDFLNFKPQTNKDKHHFVLFLEVLDNMPHDRVYKSSLAAAAKQSSDEWTEQAQVEFSDESANENLTETRRPISDPLIKEFLALKASQPQIDHIEDEKKLEGGLIQNLLRRFFKQPDDNMFIPTICLKIIKHLATAIPEHNVIFADFDMLKTSESAKMGINAPVVSQKQEKSHEKRDFATYLVKRGQADIFFPTDFRLLQHIYQKITKKRGTALKSF